jgi:hypothetical protein
VACHLRLCHGSDGVPGFNSVQQNVQQRGRTTAGLHDHGERLLAAEVVRSSCAPVVCIQAVKA